MDTGVIHTLVQRKAEKMSQRYAAEKLDRGKIQSMKRTGLESLALNMKEGGLKK